MLKMDGSLVCLIDSVPSWEFPGKNDDFVVFESQRVALANILKERMVIDKPTAAFLKSATSKAAISKEYDNGPVDIDSAAIYMLDVLWGDESNESVEANSAEISCHFETWETSWKCSQEINESTFVPRETLKITKETSEFLKESIRAKFEVILNNAEIHTRETQRYKIDHILTIQNGNETSDHYKIPSPVDIGRDDESKYLEEVLENHDVEEFSHVFYEKDIDLRPIFNQSQFQIPILEPINFEPCDNFETRYNNQFCKWNCDIVGEIDLNDLQYRSSLECFALKEELERGVEFRLKAPFMDDAPTFDEPKSAFDLIHLDELIPMIFIENNENSLSFKDIIVEISEEDIINQELDERSTFKMPFYQDNMAMIKSERPFLISSSQSENIASYKASPEPVKEISNNSTVESEVSQNPNIFQDSNVRVGDTTSFHNQTDSTNVRDNSTLNATKMTTMVQESNTIRDVTTKRPLDDDLDSLIAEKRKKTKKTSVNKDTKSLSSVVLASMLLKTNQLKTYESPTEHTSIDIPKLKVPVNFSNLFPTSSETPNMTIGINSSRTDLNYNNQILRKLDEKAVVDTLELELGSDDVDFMISPFCGLIILNLRQSLQTDMNGDLSIKDKILASKLKYKYTCVLIVVSSTDNMENLLYIQTCFSMMGVEVGVVNDQVGNICEWVTQFSYKYSDSMMKEYEDIDEIKAPIAFLMSCGVNPLIARQVLDQTDVANFITLEGDERRDAFQELITEPLLNLLEMLFSMNWNWSSNDQVP